MEGLSVAVQSKETTSPSAPTATWGEGVTVKPVPHAFEKSAPMEMIM